MARDRQLIVETVTSEKTFTNVFSILLIDAGETDGFQIAGEDDVFGVVPTGVPVSISPVDGRAISKVTVKAASGKSLNVTAIYYI